MAAMGKQNKEIAARLSLFVQIVFKWRKRFCEERLQDLQERPRGGTPPVFSPRGGAPSQAFGRCEQKTGIEPFGRLVEQVMTTEP